MFSLLPKADQFMWLLVALVANPTIDKKINKCLFYLPGTDSKIGVYVFPEVRLSHSL